MTANPSEPTASRPRLLAEVRTESAMDIHPEVIEEPERVIVTLHLPGVGLEALRHEQGVHFLRLWIDLPELHYQCLMALPVAVVAGSYLATRNGGVVEISMIKAPLSTWQRTADGVSA